MVVQRVLECTHLWHLLHCELPKIGPCLKRKDYKKWTPADEEYLTSIANDKITIADTNLGKEQAVIKKKEEQSVKDFVPRITF